MSLRRYFVCLHLLFLSQFLKAQTLDFKPILYQEGQAQSPISGFLQDSTGFIWFGNNKGLTRYDGNDYKTFVSDPSDPGSISNNRINAIFQDHKWQLWVATANGLNLYNQKQETFTRVDVREIKGGRNYISSITEDCQGNIWVGTFGGLKKVNQQRLILEDFPEDTADLRFAGTAIFSIFRDHENKIWTGTNEGLKRIDPLTRKLLSFPPELKETFSTRKILVIKADLDNNLWFGTETSGVFRFSQREESLKNYSFTAHKNAIASNWVRDILVVNRQRMLFATRNGLSELNPENGLFINYKHDTHNPKSLSDNTVWSLMKDKDNSLWIGTFTGGINFSYDGISNFQNISENSIKPLRLSNEMVTALTEDSDGSFWVGTFDGTLNHIDRKAGISTCYNVTGSEKNSVKCLADDGKGNLWMGTIDGLSLFKKKTAQLTRLNISGRNDVLSEQLILCILPDSVGAWIGTNGRGLRYTLKNGKTTVVLDKDLSFGTDKHLTDNFVTALLKEPDGHLWVGTQNGLNYYDIKSRKIIRSYKKVRENKYQLSNNNITVLFRDSGKRLWIGTEGGGLNYFDPKQERFFAIGLAQGLKDNVIRSIVEDARGDLWVSTDLGLFDIKFNSFELPFTKKNLKIISYTTRDGLIGNQYATQAGLIFQTNEVAFGGINGLTLFNPDKIIKNSIPPKIVITELLVNNKSLGIDSPGSPLRMSAIVTNSIELPYDQANLEIRFAALNFINSGNNTYAYRLMGSFPGNPWQEIGRLRVVHFANLAPGHYIFQVKGANNDGVWSKEVRSLAITILPPIWMRWWAYIIYMFLSGTIIFIIYRFLRNRAALKQALMQEHADNERLSELYHMKLEFFTNISHEIRTPLTLILGPLEKLIKENPDQHITRSIRQVKENADRLMRLIGELLDFRKAEEGHLKITTEVQDIVPFVYMIYMSFKELAGSKGIDYQFCASPENVLVNFDKNQLEKVIFNLLSNAFKHTSDKGIISLNISKASEYDHRVKIKLTNNGERIPMEVQQHLFELFYQADGNNIGTGIGLALSKKIVDLHGGIISVNSEEFPKGNTVFTVLLPAETFSALPVSPVIEASIMPETVMIEKGKFTIMIVEDNEEVRELLAAFLRPSYLIITCNNGQEALNLLEGELPDLIISDIMMPLVNGLQLCGAVKSGEATSHIPFMLLTAKADISHQLEGLGIGADAYLSKPVSLPLLELNVRNLLWARELLRKKFARHFTIGMGNTEVVSPEDKFISRLMQIIENKLEDADFGVEELVNEIGMSRTVLYKKVQMLTNFSVADLIKEIRLKKAAELLRGRSYNISEVAYMVGFNDRKHFSREFKKHHGSTPSEFVKEVKT